MRRADVRRRAGPYTDRLLQILQDNDAKATFFLIGNKVAANPEGAKRIVDAGMEIGSHTWEHPNMTTIPPEDVPAQFSKASDAIEAATGQRPKLVRTAGGVISDQVLAEAKKQGLADINWDVIPFDWINDSNIAATRYMLMTQIKPGSVVLFHDTYSSTVDLVYQFIPVLKANGYHLVTVSQLLGPREPGSTYGARDNGPPANDLREIAGRRDPAAAEHAVAAADAERPDHRHPGRQLRRTQQRRLTRAMHSQHRVRPDRPGVVLRGGLGPGQALVPGACADLRRCSESCWGRSAST